MSRDHRVQITLSPELVEALRYEAAKAGLAPSTLAGSMVWLALNETLTSREFQRHIKETREPVNPADAHDDARAARRLSAPRRAARA
jgi:hypothetical protein